MREQERRNNSKQKQRQVQERDKVRETKKAGKDGSKNKEITKQSREK